MTLTSISPQTLHQDFGMSRWNINDPRSKKEKRTVLSKYMDLGGFMHTRLLLPQTGRGQRNNLDSRIAVKYAYTVN